VVASAAVDLVGAVCLVTGATGGIGRATARRLAAEGASVLLHGRHPPALQDVAQETGGRALPCDLRRESDADRLAAESLEAFGRVDVLVNNAGFGWAGPFSTMDLGRADEMVAVNVGAAVHLTRALLPGMLERGTGAVVNVASIAGHVGVGEEAVYAATKAASIAFSESLRYEVAPRGVRVLVVSPGAVATPFFERRGRPYGRSFPRPVSAERVADALVDALRKDRSQTFVPRWLAFPVWLRGAWPGLYRAAAGRFG
jgi:short-subunit dehydrogenase